MVIVQFNDKYAVRRGFFPFYRYKDLRTNRFWWSRGSEYFSHCLCDDIEEIKKKVSADLPKYGKVIKP